MVLPAKANGGFSLLVVLLLLGALALSSAHTLRSGDSGGSGASPSLRDDS